MTSNNFSNAVGAKNFAKASDLLYLFGQRAGQAFYSNILDPSNMIYQHP